MNEKQRLTRLNYLRLQMLKQKGWRYLRYLHLSEFVRGVASSVKTIGVVGAGLGFAELAAALEHPDVEFTLTDIVATGRPNYWRCMDLTMRWDVRNVRFGVWDLLADTPCKFDAVVSTEVLEHIEDANLALLKMRSASRKMLYALTPFATDIENSNPTKRAAAFTTHEHFVCGYDENYFRAVNPSAKVFGTYWMSAGSLLRNKLSPMTALDIEAHYDSLVSEARADLIDSEPVRGMCMGVKSVMYF